MKMKVSALSQDAKKYPCPICSRLFCRDRAMVLIGGDYVCESMFWESTTCDFSFPDGLTKEEIDKSALEHISKIGERV